MLLLATLATLVPALQDPGGARWIWGAWAEELERPEGELCAFRRDVELAGGVADAYLTIAVDDAYVLFVNDKRVARESDWRTGLRYDVTDALRAGANRIEVIARNQMGPAALLAFLEIELVSGARARVDSDETWLTRRRREDGGDAGSWEPARVVAPYGGEPWGRIAFDEPGSSAWGGGEVPFDERFEAPPGFRVEEAWQSLSSLIALEIVDGTRALAAAESEGVLELVDTDGDGAFDEELPFTDAVKRCHGLLWRDGVLYCVGEGPDGLGLYRVKRDQPNAPELLGGFAGEAGEHGPHGVVAGPDGALYVAVGNHARPETPWGASSPFRTVYEGHLVPRLTDPRGHAAKINAPGGVVMRVDLATGSWDAIAGGLRNAYDLCFNAHGDLFTFDSDMEWDLGLPWYREVRLLHVVPGGEYGWRTGSSVWPNWYPDSLPPACEVGRGSPTGMVVYDAELFPARYRGAVLAGDWSRGRVIAFHLEPAGVSYTAEEEELLLGRPLNVTDLALAPDGSLLIATGGRGTNGAVLRLTYEGERGPEQALAYAEPWPAWPPDVEKPALFAALGSEDRFVRFAAGRALERAGASLRDLPPEPSALGEAALAEALVVLARNGLFRADAEDCALGLERARELVERGAQGPALLAALRAIDLFLQDADAPPLHTAGEEKALGDALLARFPTGNRDADRQLALLLAHLAPDGAPEALVAALVAEPSRAGQVHYAYALRATKSGWTPAARETFAGWLALAKSFGGGYSSPGYVRRIARDAAELFGPEHAHLFESSAEPGPAWTRPAAYGGAPWSLDATAAFLDGALQAPRRSLDEGARVFTATCARCHPFGPASASNSNGGTAGSLGPDLAGVARRFSRADLLESIFAPSRVVPEAYRALQVFLTDGSVQVGLVIEDSSDALILARTDGTSVTIDPADIDERRPSVLSTMPQGLLDALTLEEVADLVYYLESDAPRPAPEASAWKRLFDGKSLSGWIFDEQLWRVDSGLVLGAGDDLPGSSFLISDATYSDFALEFDLRVDAGNSGLQFRAERRGGFALAGYQADAGEVYWGSLYEEGGRGMLHRTPDEVWVPAIDEHGFNHYVVEARGDRLQIEVNGTLMTDLRDDAAASGHFGFQLHTGDTRIALRNVRVLVR